MSVGQTIRHDSAPLHVSGRATYVDDLPELPGSVHLAFGLSQRAHAGFEMDLTAVRAADGVIAVLTAGDLPFENDASPSAHDEPVLAVEEVHYVGQPMFLVVATSHLAARKAAKLAKVEYSDLPAILSLDAALEANSRFGDPLIYARGDAEAGITEAPQQIEDTFELGGQEHFYLEGQVAAATPLESGELKIHTSTQHPSEIQHKVAEAVGRPFADIVVEVRRMGGGFGGKESQGNHLAIACAVVAQKLNRPARMRYDRDDDMIITGKRHDFRISYRAGFDDSGQLAGVEFTHLVRCGWAQDLSFPVADRAMLHADNAYYLPAVKITSDRLRTNTQSNTAYRGFGGPQGMVGIERVMDHIARVLGKDALEVRRANFYGPAGSDERVTTPYHMKVEDNIIHELVDELATRADYGVRRAEITAFNAANPIIKRGLALTPVKFGISFTLTHLNQAGALVQIYTDGSIRLNHGGTEMGQGLFTKVAQVAAEEFGVPLKSVRITATDTAKVPNTSATAASSGADLNGMATKAACGTLRARLTHFAASKWNVTEDQIEFAAGRVRVGAQEMRFAELVQAAYAARIQLSATGFYATPKIEWDRIAGKGRPFLYFAYGAALAEVALDTLTGENRILRVDILHDAGASLNPALDIGQVEGAFVQGAGWLTTEELVWNDHGMLTTHAPSTYKIPACGDRPREFNVGLWKKGRNAEDTIYRSKAVGEPPFMLGLSVPAAYLDALQAAGSDALPDLPFTAERLLMALPE